MKSKLSLSLCVGIVAICLLCPFETVFSQEPVQTLMDTFIALPASAHVSLRWIVPPSEAQDFSAVKFIRQHQNLGFSIDSDGNAWIGFDSQLICPTKQLTFSLSERFQQFIHLNNGAMIFSTVAKLGLALADDTRARDASGLPVLAFQPFAALPKTFSRIYKGGLCLYAVSEEPSGRSVVYMLAQEAGQKSKKLAIRRWIRLFATEQHIDALTGDGELTCFAHGSSVFYHKRSTKQMGGIFAGLAQGEVIRQLAETSGSLYYATDHRVGSLGAHQSHTIIETPFPQLSAHQDKLYVLFPNCMGVAVLENLKELEAVF